VHGEALSAHFVDERVQAGGAEKGLHSRGREWAGGYNGLEGGELCPNAADKTGPVCDILVNEICPAKKYVRKEGRKPRPELGLPDFGEVAEGEGKGLDGFDGRR